MSVTGVLALISGCFCCCFLCGSQAKTPIPVRKIDENVSGGDANSGSDDSHPSNKTKKYAPWLGIKRGVAMIFLPVVTFLRDFGVEWCGGFIEAITQSGTSQEMPTMSTTTSFDSEDGTSIGVSASDWGDQQQSRRVRGPRSLVTSTTNEDV